MNLYEAKRILKKNNVKIVKEAASDADERENDLIKRLAEYLDTDEDAIEVHGDAKDAIVYVGNEEYIVFYDEDDAIAAAVDQAMDILDDTGIEGIRFDMMGKSVEDFIDDDQFEDIWEESTQATLDDMTDEEKQEEYGTTDDEEIIDQIREDEVGEGFYVQWFIDNFGKEELNDMIKHNRVQFNKKKLAEEIVDTDGAANTLASYDGEEIDLGDGILAYRVN